MRIALDLSPLQPPMTGVGQYTHGLVCALLEENSGHEFRAWSTGLRPLRLAPPMDTLRHKHLGLPTRALYKSWELLGAPSIDTLLGGADIVHATNFFLPPTRKARRIVTIYDIAFIKHPEWASPKIVGPFSRGVRRFVKSADAIITISEASKGDLCDILGAAPEKIHIAYPAVEDSFRPIHREEAQRQVLERHGVSAPYLLFVSTLEPRKNITALLEAFAALQHKIPHQLVLVGGEGWNPQPTPQLIQKLGVENRVSRLGYLKSRAELPALYGGADAFVFPSHYEGFGMPVLEAMRCGCPVITARNSALSEVGGDAVRYVEARDTAGLAAEMERVAMDTTVQSALRVLGLVQAEKFSWRRCAQDTLAVYGKLA